MHSRSTTTRPPRVLFVQYSANLSGSTISGRLVVEALREGGADVDVVFAFDGPARQQFAALGCHTELIDHGRWLRPAGRLGSARRIAHDLRAAAAFGRLLARRPADLVYVNSFVGAAAVVAARRARIPCIWHLRELFADVGGELHDPALGGRMLVRAAVRRLPNRVIAISRSIVRDVLGPQFEASVDVLPNAIPLEFFEPLPEPAECRRRLNLPARGSLIGLPGTLRPVKGVELFIEAASRMADEAEQCHFAVTGHGAAEYAQQLRAHVMRLGLQDRFHFVGVVREMPLFYGACDVVCIPSRSESFGRTVVEAMATGTPLVATSVGGIREIVQHNRTGWLVPYGDADILADALRTLLHDTERQKRYAEAGRREANLHYRADVYREAIRRRVDDLLRETGRPRLNVTVEPRETARHVAT